MFTFNNGKWKPMEKKISFKAQRIVYDDDDFPYRNNPKNSEITVEEISLTDDQLHRLEVLKHIDTIGVKGVEKYVLTGELLDPSEDLKAAVKQDEMRSLIARHIPTDALTPEEAEQLKATFRGFEPGGFYKADEVLADKDKLYKVKEAHKAKEEKQPDATPEFYEEIPVQEATALPDPISEPAATE